MSSFLGFRYVPAERQLLHSYLSNKLVLGATALFFVVVFCAVFAHWIAPVDPLGQTLRARLRPPIWYERGMRPYYLGTDRLGRDVLSNIIYGLRISLIVGILSVGLSLIIGLTLGLIAGYARGFWENFIMRAVDVQLSLPLIMVAMCFMVIFGQGLGKMIIVIAITGWAEYARTVRGTVLSIREKEYVEAANALGFSPGTIMIKYLLINAITPILVLTAVQVPRVIILESTLSFLGVGVPVTTPSIGMCIARGYQVLFSGSWWASIFPGIGLMLLVGCINVLADWLRDALEPRSREQV
jgi:peptide/nickel transport system permease protein